MVICFQSRSLAFDHDIDVAAVGGVDADCLTLVVEVRVVRVLLDLHRLQKTSHSAVWQDDVLLGVVDLDDGGVVGLGLGLVIHFGGG